jgi:hypothetical protein
LRLEPVGRLAPLSRAGVAAELHEHQGVAGPDGLDLKAVGHGVRLGPPSPPFLIQTHHLAQSPVYPSGRVSLTGTLTQPLSVRFINQTRPHEKHVTRTFSSSSSKVVKVRVSPQTHIAVAVSGTVVWLGRFGHDLESGLGLGPEPDPKGVPVPALSPLHGSDPIEPPENDIDPIAAGGALDGHNLRDLHPDLSVPPFRKRRHPIFR